MGKLSGLTKKRIDEQVRYWGPIFKIEFALDRLINNYSKGMLQRIGFLVTLLHDPEFVILDEPLSGLDPVGRKELKDVIIKINEKGKTIFFSSHIVSDVEEVSDDVIFLKSGELAYQGAIDSLLESHSKDKVFIRYRENGKTNLITSNFDKKNSDILNLINKGNEIISVENEKVTLEEIIYHV